MYNLNLEGHGMHWIISLRTTVHMLSNAVLAHVRTCD